MSGLVDKVDISDEKLKEQVVTSLEKIADDIFDNETIIEIGRNNNDNPVIDEDYIKNVNNIVLINVLSPQVVKNENTKRIHKYWLIVILSIFLIAQFGMTFYIINKVFGFIFTYYSENKSIDNHLINLLFTFITGYITSVVVELIYMLKCIVKNVFDTSISDLVKLFKEEIKNS